MGASGHRDEEQHEARHARSIESGAPDRDCDSAGVLPLVRLYRVARAAITYSVPNVAIVSTSR